MKSTFKLDNEISKMLLQYQLDLFAGPDLPTALDGHIMVTLGLGQAILGGQDNNYVFRKEIYHFTCYQQDCTISLLSQLLEVPRSFFVAIPIPDSLSGCISDSKYGCSYYLFSDKPDKDDIW